MAENLDGKDMENTADAGAAANGTGITFTDKSQKLVDIANNTFRELCRTLENEQTKLMELEERRKKLQEEMQRLKMEIEEEKQTYRLNLTESISDNLDVLNETRKTTSEPLPFNIEAETESVHDFIERQKAEIKRLTRESALDVCIEMDEKNDQEPEIGEDEEVNLTATNESDINTADGGIQDDK